MDTYELVIIGSGPGGVGAANAYIAAGGPTPVLLLTGEHVPPYDRPPLSKEKLRAPAPPEPHRSTRRRTSRCASAPP
ncbi:NAD(P)/FAD-dependent oxidoreductase [Cumulibacter manganitolerans]|uniref:NAD(P)/FAD-dependent oxidoreductase n=1 Tax=Cumulibacter manganitolerans TaxID=1884992 RepID=UPI001E4A0581|nr:NAD(P)/FAD-dependent oxidoreductase [Cumulibacter manganitolerans]